MENKTGITNHPDTYLKINSNHNQIMRYKVHKQTPAQLLNYFLKKDVD